MTHCLKRTLIIDNVGMTRRFFSSAAYKRCVYIYDCTAYESDERKETLLGAVIDLVSMMYDPPFRFSDLLLLTE